VVVKTHGVTDETLVKSLSVYAGMVSKVVADPEQWLGVDEDADTEPTSLPQRALDAIKDHTLGTVTPASAEWAAQPLQQRVDWWVDRIAVGAGLAAAAPRLAGALADRLPLQAALGAAATGLAVCAVAREHGLTEPGDWVPLLAKVLFDRELRPAVDTPVPAAEDAEQALRAGEPDDDRGGPVAALARGAQHSARTLWRLAGAFRDLQHLLDDRPRGGILARGLAKVPVVGVAGGWLDERGAIRKAAKETAGLIA
jgi:hypothetical protein